MTFFKNTRDTLKASSLISQLQSALRHFKADDTAQSEQNLRGAEKALAQIESANAKLGFSEDFWFEVSQLAAQLDKEFRRNGFIELATCAADINYRACLVRIEMDPICSSECAIIGPVDEDGFLIEPPFGPQSKRDPPA